MNTKKTKNKHGNVKLSEVESFFELLKAVSAAFDETVYVIDFEQRCFRFVSDGGMFLCGNSPKKMMQMGYSFYREAIFIEDYNLVENTLQAVADYFSDPKTRIRELAYIVFDFKASGYKGKIRLSHKFIPLIIDNKATMAICSVSRSASKTSGNLYAYYNNVKLKNRATNDSLP